MPVCVNIAALLPRIACDPQFIEEGREIIVRLD